MGNSESMVEQLLPCRVIGSVTPFVLVDRIRNLIRPFAQPEGLKSLSNIH